DRLQHRRANRRDFRAFAEQTKSDLEALAACIRGSRQTLTRAEVTAIRAPVLGAGGTKDGGSGSAEHPAGRRASVGRRACRGEEWSRGICRGGRLRPGGANRRDSRAFAEQTKSDLEALAACIRGSRQTLTRAEVTAIRAPVLVAVGTKDVVAGSAHDLAALLP